MREWQYVRIVGENGLSAFRHKFRVGEIKRENDRCENCGEGWSLDKSIRIAKCEQFVTFMYGIRDVNPGLEHVVLYHTLQLRRCVI